VSALLLLGAAVVLAASDDAPAPGAFGGPGSLTGQQPLPGVSIPIPGVAGVAGVAAVALTLAATALHNNGTGVLAAPPGAIVVLRTRIATLHRGRHFKLRARTYRWSTGKYGAAVQLCQTRQWEVQWNLLANTVQWELEPWGGVGSQECVPLPGLQNYGMSPAWSLEREGDELWLRMTASNTSDSPSTYDLQSWATGGGDFP
jgi:hypothetical protein